MDWEAHCHDFMSNRGVSGSVAEEKRRQAIDAARSAIESEQSEEFEWLAIALADNYKKWFAAWVFREVVLVPERLFAPMIRAAVYEINPSFNNQFIEPCVHSFGYRRVNEALLEYLEHGTDWEKAGASNALYWAQAPKVYRQKQDLPAEPITSNRHQIQFTRIPNPEYDSLADIRLRIRCIYLKEFVGNNSVDVRRSILGKLSLAPSDYPEDFRPLIPVAIQIAREHPDDYIRHRVEVQLGATSLLNALPHRVQGEDSTGAS